jgi:hypothetical protein
MDISEIRLRKKVPEVILATEVIDDIDGEEVNCEFLPADDDDEDQAQAIDYMRALGIIEETHSLLLLMNVVPVGRVIRDKMIALQTRITTYMTGG